jgi:hypothetical protein
LLDVPPGRQEDEIQGPQETFLNDLLTALNRCVGGVLQFRRFFFDLLARLRLQGLAFTKQGLDGLDAALGGQRVSAKAAKPDVARGFAGLRQEFFPIDAADQCGGFLAHVFLLYRVAVE